MECKNCHATVEDGAQFCANCGTPVDAQPDNVESSVISEPISQDVSASDVVASNSSEVLTAENVSSSELPTADSFGKPKNQNLFVVLTVVFGFLTVVASALAIVGFASKKEVTCTSDTPSTSTSTSLVGSSESVLFEGYKLNVPAGYTYEFHTDEKGNKSLNFINAAGSNIISLKYYKVLTFSAIGEKVSSLSTSFAEQLKDSTTKFGHETVSGMEFHTVNVTMEDKSSVMYAWAKAGLYSFMAYIHSTTGASSDLLADFAKIMNGASQQTKTQTFEEKYPALFEEKFLDLNFDVLTD